MARTILDYPVQNPGAAYQFAVQTILNESYEAKQEAEGIVYKKGNRSIHSSRDNKPLIHEEPKRGFFPRFSL